MISFHVYQMLDVVFFHFAFGRFVGAKQLSFASRPPNIQQILTNWPKNQIFHEMSQKSEISAPCVTCCQENDLRQSHKQNPSPRKSRELGSWVPTCPNSPASGLEHKGSWAAFFFFFIFGGRNCRVLVGGKSGRHETCDELYH